MGHGGRGVGLARREVGRRARRPGAPVVIAALVLAPVLVLGAPLTAEGRPVPLRGVPTDSAGAIPPPPAATTTTDPEAQTTADSRATVDAPAPAPDEPSGTGDGSTTSVRGGVVPRDKAHQAAAVAEPANRDVRPRGLPVPVEFEDAVGVVREAEEARERANPSGERVWPLVPGRFDFTQAFGCVPQIGGYYEVVPGCPGKAPGFHTGIDLAAPTGTRFFAAASGWVIEAGLDRPTGVANTRILIQHDGPNDGYATEYLHWITTYVEPGQYVEAGQPLGEVGSVGFSTGPHLHFGVADVDAGSLLDPLRWLPRDPTGGTYRGLAPGSRPITFDNVGVGLPDYADPAPPPVPRRREVPQRQRTGNAPRADQEWPDRVDPPAASPADTPADPAPDAPGDDPARRDHEDRRDREPSRDQPPTDQPPADAPPAADPPPPPTERPPAEEPPADEPPAEAEPPPDDSGSEPDRPDRRRRGRG